MAIAGLAAFSQGQGASLGGGTSSADPNASLTGGDNVFNIGAAPAGGNKWVAPAAIGVAALLAAVLIIRK